MRIYTSPEGKKLVVYDGVNDPPGWWKHVQIPGQRRRGWPWWAWLLVVAGVMLLPFALMAMAGLLFIKIVSKPSKGAYVTNRRRRRGW